MYFSAFPNVKYTLDDKVSYQNIQDIFRRVLLSYTIKTGASYFQVYDIKDKETPEIVADKFYRSAKLHWIILHANEIIDPRYDWCMSDYDLLEYVKAKYGDENVYSIHHYEKVLYEGTDAEIVITSPTTTITNLDGVTITYPISVSNFEYEVALNEKKRSIKIVEPQLVPSLITTFNNIIKV